MRLARGGRAGLGGWDLEKTEQGATSTYLSVRLSIHPCTQSFSMYLVSTYYVQGIMEGGHKFPAFPILSLFPRPPRFLLRECWKEHRIGNQGRPLGGRSVPWLD